MTSGRSSLLGVQCACIKWLCSLKLFAPFIGFYLLLPLGMPHSLLGPAQENKAQPSRAPLIHKSELLNGLRVIVVQRSGLSPKVSLNLLVKVGSALDPPNKMGVANLTAQALFYANQQQTPESFQEELEELGVEFKIRVDPDATVFQAEVPSSNLESFLSLFSSRVARPLLREERIETIKRETIESRIRLQDPLRLATEHFRALIFGKHPYTKTLQGNRQSISGIRLEDLKEFYKAYYSPNNAALVVVGETTPSLLVNLAREKLGGWVKKPLIQIQYPEVASGERFSLVFVEDGISHEATLVYGQSGPPRITPDFYALKIMNSIIGGLGQSSRLVQGFLARNINFTTLRSEFEFYQAGGQFQVVVQLPSHSVTQALQAISDILDALKSSGITDAELKASKACLEEWYSEVLNSPPLLADQAAAMELYNLANDFLVSFPKRVEQLTLERIAEAAKSYLDTSRASAVVVSSDIGLIPELKKLGDLEVVKEPPVSDQDH